MPLEVIEVTAIVSCANKFCGHVQRVTGTNLLECEHEATEKQWRLMSGYQTNVVGWWCPECAMRIKEQRKIGYLAGDGQ